MQIDGKVATKKKASAKKYTFALIGAYVIGYHRSCFFFGVFCELFAFICWLHRLAVKSRFCNLFFLPFFVHHFKVQHVEATVICLGHSIFRLFILIIENEAKKKWFNNKGTHATTYVPHNALKKHDHDDDDNDEHQREKAKFSNDNL